MNKKMIFGIMLVAVVALGALDFFVSGYGDQIRMKASVQDLVKMGQNFAEEVTEQNPKIVLEEEETPTTIFNKVDLEKINAIKAAKSFLLTKNGANYLRLYTFDFGSAENQINYLMLKTLFSDLNKAQPNIEVNEVDNYGVNSFYVNDTNDDAVVRIVILTNDSVYGVEYAKVISKDSIDPLLSILTNKDNSDIEDANTE